MRENNKITTTYNWNIWQDDTFSCDILDLYAIPMLKYRPVKKINWAYSGILLELIQYQVILNANENFVMHLS